MILKKLFNIFELIWNLIFPLFQCSSKQVRSSDFPSHKKSRQYFDVKWLIISLNVSRSSSGVFLKVFWITLFSDRSPPRTSLDFTGLLLVFVEFMPDKVILDHKKSYLVYFQNFHFSLMANFCLKLKKIKILTNWPNMTFYGLKWLYLA